MPETFRVGLLGHGTVGVGVRDAAGRARRRDRADHRRAPGAVGRADALARLVRGDPRGLGPDRRADGRARAGARVRAARHAGRQARRLGQQAAALRPRRGAVGDGARARRAAALRGRRGGRRAGHPRAPGVAGRRAHRARARDRQRDDELHPQRDGGRRDDATTRRSARRRRSATPRPTRPTTSPARTPRPRWRSSRGWRSRRPCTSTRSATRASSRSPPTTWPTRASSGWG